MSASRTASGAFGAGPARPIDPLVVLFLGPTGSGKTALSLALGRALQRRNRQLRFGRRLSRHGPRHRQALAGRTRPPPASPHRRRRPRPALHRRRLQPPCPRRPARHRRRGTPPHRHRRHRPLPARTYRRPLRRPRRARKTCATACRRSVERRGSAWLHRLLARLDPASAARIHANDTPKLIRAIEVCLAARQPHVAGPGTRSSHRLPPPPHRPQPAARSSSMSGSTSAAPRCSPPASSKRPAPCSRATALSRRSTRSATVRRSPSCARALSERGRNCRSPAGPSQLRQAPADLVPPRARRALDRSLRRRSRDATHCSGGPGAYESNSSGALHQTLKCGHP